MNAYEKVQKHFEDMRERDIKVRSMSYIGEGRPKKSDYKIIKLKDYMDFLCMERLQFGIIPHDTN